MANTEPSDATGGAAGGQAPRHATVLVCDDDRLVLLTLAAALRGAGFEVIEADNGDDAILLARQHHPDLALLDIRMDGKSGLDVASYLRDYVGTPFMFLSAFNDERFIRKAREFGALDYLVKPVDIERIAPAVAAALRRAAEGQRPARGGGPAPAMPTDAEPAPPEDPRGAGAVAVAAPAEDLDVRGALEAIAVGILMERFRLTRVAAEQRLAAQARHCGRSALQVAEELVRGVDVINSTGGAAP